MNYSVIINEIISLFLVIIVGVYCFRKNIITEEVNDYLVKLLLDISLPCMIIRSFLFEFNSEIVKSIIKSFIYSPIVILVTLIISKVLLIKIEPKQRAVMHFANIFSNCGFIGFPVVNSVFGYEGVIYASIFNMFFNIFLWTYGVMIFSNNKNKDKYKYKKLLNPSIIAVLIGLILMIFNIKLPNVFDSTLSLIGGVTTPISMLIVGVILAKVNFVNYLKDYRVYYSNFLKLVFLPIILIVIFKLFNESSIVAKTMIIITAMPAGVMNSIFAKKYGGDEEYSAMIVFSTTLMSALTVPIMIRLIL